jgi:hypothetical protein
MTYDWGPRYIVPTEALKTLSGNIQLRETLDEEMLGKDLEALGLPRQVLRIVNPWYCRRKGTETWVKIGESDDKERNFAVSWDTTRLENGQYEVLGLMHAIAHRGDEEAVIARQNIIEVTVEN